MKGAKRDVERRKERQELKREEKETEEKSREERGKMMERETDEKIRIEEDMNRKKMHRKWVMIKKRKQKQNVKSKKTFSQIKLYELCAIEQGEHKTTVQHSAKGPEDLILNIRIICNRSITLAINKKGNPRLNMTSIL